MDAATIAAIGMQNDQLRLDAISQNLANVLTPGYKKQMVTGQSFADQVKGIADQARSASATQQSTLPAVAIDASAGTLRVSSNPQDLAIDGDGFFEVATDRGPAFTRVASLRADVKGRLVGVQDLPLMGVGGELSVTNAPINVAPNGDVRQGDRLVGRLKLVRFANPDALQPIGGAMYAQGQARLATTGVDGMLRAGFQENSNVSSPQEMVRLTETVRHFEALQKIIQGHDEAVEKTMRKLGEF
jgi:flagellar basal-body rod protein FlgF